MLGYSSKQGKNRPRLTVQGVSTLSVLGVVTFTLKGTYYLHFSDEEMGFRELKYFAQGHTGAKFLKNDLLLRNRPPHSSAA